MIVNVFAYLRVSGKSQVRGDGFTRQFKAIREYCLKNEFKIVRVFKERGVSGTKELENRPALSMLFAALEDDGVKVVVIEKLDRIARDLMIQETILQDMHKNDYVLHSTCEPDLNSDEPSRILIRQIFGALAQWDRAMIVIKLKAARERIKSEGRKPGQKNYSPDHALNTNAEGRKPFGQKPGEGPILQLMIDLKSKGKTGLQIAQELNEKGIPTRMGKKWRETTVAKILARQKS